MKKIFLTCVAVLAVLAIAASASAITCTVDQRPAATLLVPYFAVSLTPTATVDNTSPGSVDTLLTIGNASSAPMIAHVSVFNSRSTLVLDFNIALTGFDVQSMRLSDVLSGFLPSTPIKKTHVGPNVSVDPSPDDACQRNTLSAVYPAANGYLRVKPATNALAATPDDNGLSTTAYPTPAFGATTTFGKQVVDSLDSTVDSLGCGTGAVDGVTSGPAVGYITIDHANYCNLSNPSDPNYYAFNALGMENNLWGDIIFLNRSGVGTYGMSTVNIESDPSFSGANQSPTARARTFYARYWAPPQPACANCSGTLASGNNLLLNSPWNVGNGDQREPLGLKYAARYLQIPPPAGSPTGGVSSFFDVWRTSPFRNPSDLTGTPAGKCTDVEPTVQLNFFDEDENGVSQIGPGPCPSPCSTPPPPTFNFPLETNRKPVTDFTLPTPLPSGVSAGWVSMGFNNLTTGTNLDQAWVAYEFQGAGAFLSAHVPGTQLDPSTCQPLGVTGVNPVTPVIPGGVTGTGNPPAGTGP